MCTPDTTPPNPTFTAHIGLDWADRKHFWSMRTADGKFSRGELDHTPEAIEVWAAELAQRFAGQPIALSLEQSRGALVAVLSKYAHLHLFPVHSSTLAHYRKSACPSGAKSDPVDGDLILDYLLKHPDKLRALQPDTVETRSLRFLVEERRNLVARHTSEVQVLTHWLKQIFPQILNWFDDVSTPLVGDLLQRWGGLVELRKVSPKTLRRFFQEHNCRSEELIQQRLDGIREAVPATTDRALLQTGGLRVRVAVELLAQLRAAIAEFDREIAAVYATHPDRFLVEALPGAGPALEPRLIAALGTIRERFQSASSMACCFGIAPVTERSGNMWWVHWRWACSKFLRQTFHEWAACSIRVCDWARAHYDSQRAKGKGHHAAVRSVAYKWIRIVFRCWKDRVAYSEPRYLEALRARGAASSQPAKTDKKNPAAKKAPHDKKAPAAKHMALRMAQWKQCGSFFKLA